MLLPSVLVTDTSLWIDLENGGILAAIFLLPYRFVVPDFAIPELVHPAWDTLHAMGLEALELSPAQVAELQQLRESHRNLSIIDLAAFLLARHLPAALLTGDGHLTKQARAHGLPVHGVLWLLDQMVDFQALAPGQAAAALSLMLAQNARLPTAECISRLSKWSA